MARGGAQTSEGCVGRVQGKGHGGASVGALAVSAPSLKLLSVGMDDKALWSKLPAEEYGAQQV
eukprot:8791470-Pyramimonas_sp.AAC.1